MAMYRVTWEIDLDADSHREAAELALNIHRDPDSIATNFTVTDTDAGTPPVVIDFNPEG
jgi:hypothetical protein